ncbi:SDC1 protein, partial [Prunella himalayana]|nr:SDC1 protein [Prunella himalayana]
HIFLFFSLKQTTNLNLPPEDLDSSGDEDDAFSGSGAGPLTDQSRTWRIPGESTNSSVMEGPVDFSEQPFHGIESRTEKEAISPSATSNLVTEEPAVAVKDEGSILGSPDGKPTSHVVTTTVRSSTAHLPSVVHVTPSEASAVVHELEPKIPSSDVPDTKDVPEPHSTVHGEGDAAATPAAPGDVLPTHEEVSEDGSGDPGDFILTKDEELVPTQNSEVLADSERNAKAAGASGIMDRKEVLGGVIAGGLVGLVFAVFLVAFMLYRMKKKDEGSYSLDEPKQSNGGYQKPHKQEEFYA